MIPRVEKGDAIGLIGRSSHAVRLSIEQHSDSGMASEPPVSQSPCTAGAHFPRANPFRPTALPKFHLDIVS